MPNQLNYRTNIEATTLQGYSRFSVSRIVDLPLDNLIEEEIPADFPVDIDASVEIALYSLADNSLIYSDYVKNDYEAENNIVSTKVIQYGDNSLRRFVLIDFSKFIKIVGLLPLGTFSLTLSFLAKEIGEFDNKNLKVTQISPSRTEIELELIGGQEKQKLIEFATPKITKDWVDEVLIQIFNQSMEGKELPPVSPVGITSGSIQNTFGTTLTNQLSTYGFDEDAESKPGIYTVAQTVLDTAYPLAVEQVNTYFLSGNLFIDKNKLNTIVEEALDDAFDVVYADTQLNPSKYRFNII